ncbi:hypothetical protein CPB85DRAFT_183045 [Mucidula mucida]|nr:hypothetical protein CPB85DRAFT_183045 [Mucidula mucida]
MDINDPVGVKALLDSLQASQAWKTVTESESSHTSNSLSSDGEPSSATVASLLAQLKSDPIPPAPSYPSFLNEQRPYSWNQDQTPSSFISPAPEDRREYSYKQSLPVLAELSQDPGFIEKINQVLSARN